jgi:hypothetical protein
LHTFLLPNDLGAQGVVKVPRIIATDAGIELLSGRGSHGYSPQQVKPLASPLAQGQGASRRNNFDWVKKSMAGANLRRGVPGKQHPHTKRHTIVAVLETVSRRETMFQICAK